MPATYGTGRRFWIGPLNAGKHPATSCICVCIINLTKLKGRKNEEEKEIKKNKTIHFAMGANGE